MINFLSYELIPFAVTSTDLAPGLKGDVWELVLHSGPVVKLVIITLLLLSVCCWGITIFKFLQFRSVFKESEAFLNLFWESSQLSLVFQEAKRFQQSPLAEIFRSGFLESQKFKNRNIKSFSGTAQTKPDSGITPGTGTESIKRALGQASVSEHARLEKYLTVLATTGSTAPFIGLFGTVWGIMDSFRQIGVMGSASLAVVAPGISEALIATAFGLLAAIPAVIAYNYYLNKIRVISSEMDNFSSEFLNIIERYFGRVNK
jgi:biopolymer transport protein TolQ